MKRPMLVIGFSSLLSLLLAVRIGAKAQLLLSAFFITLFLFVSLLGKSRKTAALSTALLSAGLAVLWLLGVNEFYMKPAGAVCAENTTVTGTLLFVPEEREENGSFHYLLKTTRVGDKTLSRKLRLTVYKKIEAELYDEVTFDGRVFLLGDESSKYGLSYKARRTVLGAYTAKPVQKTGAFRRTPYYYILIEKQKLIDKLCESVDGDSAGLCVALLFGDKGRISDECYGNMRDAGLSHLMAVSGMHLSAWMTLLSFFLDRLRLRRRVKALLLFLPMLAVMAFSAFSVSVMRAGLMMSLFLLGKLIDRRTDGFNSLGFACFALILFNPYIVGDVSFLLSVSATAGVLFCTQVFFPETEKAFSDRRGIGYAFLRRLLQTAMISLSAQLFTMPVTLAVFGKIYPYGVFANLLVSLPSVFCMFGAGAFGVLSLFPYVGQGAAAALELSGSFVAGVAKLFAGLPGACLKADYLFTYVGLAALAMSFTAMYALSRKPAKSAAVSLAVAAVCAGACAVVAG